MNLPPDRPARHTSPSIGFTGRYRYLGHARARRLDRILRHADPSFGTVDPVGGITSQVLRASCRCPEQGSLAPSSTVLLVWDCTLPNYHTTGRCHLGRGTYALPAHWVVLEVIYGHDEGAFFLPDRVVVCTVRPHYTEAHAYYQPFSLSPTHLLTHTSITGLVLQRPHPCYA